ncbi:hypothetical protein ZHAS_00003963 [Anopheles sinensis]|uniref:Uncharacterized protein n=1 Tax=Anopheles sinensis TaxID=74873 RepID=A0A084VFQ7_ANOSI|nr:hypothetical protein ZHAS_00003963 [Anopheles sinensis]
MPAALTDGSLGVSSPANVQEPARLRALISCIHDPQARSLSHGASERARANGYGWVTDNFPFVDAENIRCTRSHQSPVNAVHVFRTGRLVRSRRRICNAQARGGPLVSTASTRFRARPHHHHPALRDPNCGAVPTPNSNA